MWLTTGLHPSCFIALAMFGFLLLGSSWFAGIISIVPFLPDTDGCKEDVVHVGWGRVLLKKQLISSRVDVPIKL